MMEFLVGIIIALVSGIVGKVIGSIGRVEKVSCVQMRESCQTLLVEKMEHISNRLDELAKIIDVKILKI